MFNSQFPILIRGEPTRASPQGGVAASFKRFREASEADADGLVFLLVPERKPTPASLEAARCRACAARLFADASRHFLDRSATPPCGDARRGMKLHSNSFALSTVRFCPMVFISRCPSIFEVARRWMVSVRRRQMPGKRPPPRSPRCGRPHLSSRASRPFQPGRQ